MLIRELGQDWLALTSAYTLYIDTFSIDLIQQPSHQQCHVATLSNISLIRPVDRIQGRLRLIGTAVSTLFLPS